jgi:ribonuclease HII
VLKEYYKKGIIEAGCDEAGRGCLAGPVVAAAVIFPPNYSNKILNDSKKINEKVRDELRLVIENDALAYGVGVLSNEEIDNVNILKASFFAMHKAIDNLKIKPAFLLIDGNRFIQYKKTPHACIIKGDAKFQSIAAASILAKTWRDEIMKNLHNEFPVYNWKKNKGYPTKAHREAIRKNGITPYHRKSFQLLPIEDAIQF